MSITRALSPEVLNGFRSNFYSSTKNLLAQNACTKLDPAEVSMSRKTLEHTRHVFNHKIDSEVKPITNQKSSGRCWIFAILNVMRAPFVKMYNIEEFEFSQSYLFYWDKIERCNYFLDSIVKTAKRGEAVDSRLVSFLLADPAQDGGQWDMLVNLIKKHGVMPKNAFPESYSSESTGRMNGILKSKLREFAKALRDLVAKDASETEINSLVLEQMNTIYRIVGICLGIPDDKFTWEYYDKTKAYKSVGPIAPKEFYERYVKPCFNVDDKFCLVSDPRPSNPFGKLYTVDCLGNMVDGRLTIYNNQPAEVLMKVCAESIKNNEPVWFGSEVSKRFSQKKGIQDLQCHNYKATFDTDVFVDLDKAHRLMYGESSMTHAMVFTAVSIDENNEIKKFRVENSWGEDYGDKGYFVLTADWFDEFVFEAVIDKKYLSPAVMDVFKQEPIVLPAWDPMGTLAQ